MDKEERRELLAQVERSSPRTSQPADLQRAQRALEAGDLGTARRLLDQLTATAPQLPGVGLLSDRLAKAEGADRRTASLRRTEELLVGYIQQRKKPLAMLAVETFAELAPHHPRLADYRRWVEELDQEVAHQQRIDGVAGRVRRALEGGELEEARQQLKLLRKIDPEGDTGELLIRQLEQVETHRAEQQGIERSKQLIDERMAAGDFLTAGREIEGLAALGVPKITLDFLRQRLAQARAAAQNQERLGDLERRFRHHLEARRWDAARDIAHEAGELYPESRRAQDMFNEVDRREAEQRRAYSLAQGITTLEGFIAEGRRREAELALKVLDGLQLDPTKRARYAALIERLGS